MKFIVPEISWAGGCIPESILKQSLIAYTLHREEAKCAGYFEVDITPEQLASLAENKEIDIMISNGWLLFDSAGKRFRQR